jgi:hypothetical protein
MRNFKIILTTNKKIITKYVSVENPLELKGIINNIIDTEGLGKLKYPPKVVDMDKTEQMKAVRKTGIVNPKVPKQVSGCAPKGTKAEAHKAR